MKWEDLQFVLAVERDGTLVGASRTLGVAHTTVSRRLRALESDLGVRLFDRTPGGLVPTPAGEDLARTAGSVERQVLSAEGRVRGRDAELRGKLLFSTVDVLFTCFSDAIASFVDRYPEVELTLRITRETVSLPQREADVVLRLSREPPETLVGRRVGSMQFGVYAARALVDSLGEEAPLSAYPWLGWDGGPHLRWFDGWLAEHAPGAKVVMRLNDRGLLMAHAVAAGLGAQVIPCVLGDRNPTLVRIAPLEELFRLPLWLLTSRDLMDTQRVREFMRHMAEALVARRAELLPE